MADSAVSRPSDPQAPIVSSSDTANILLSREAMQDGIKHQEHNTATGVNNAPLWGVLFAITIFLGAFLLFQVQPILGKFILPWFGGSPGVWTTCMLVFQCLLFGGYAYAHLLSSHLKLFQQVCVHIAMLVLAMCMLPITPSSEWKPIGDESPIGSIVLLLIFNVGVPYFLLSSTGPLLQSWLTQSKIIDKPYRLYSLSNIGSMLALLSFPFWFETAFSSTEQAGIWSYGFLTYGALCIAGAIGVGIIAKRQGIGAKETETNQSDASHSDASSNVTWGDRLHWLCMASLPSLLLLAVTNHVCLDTAVIPFLWIAPLAIYLLSFILTFDSERWYNRRVCIQLAVVSFLILLVAKRWMAETPLWVDIVFNFSGLFFTCMVCHGELYASRPAPKYLTSFYLSISFGGALGGLAVGLVAPYLFNGFYEYQIGILCSAIVFIGAYLRMNSVWRNEVSERFKWGVGLGLVVIVSGFMLNSAPSGVLLAVRNFYGVLILKNGKDVQREGDLRQLLHGRIVHGSQYIDEARKNTPTTYYTETSGVGQAILALNDKPIRIGVVGLGSGTLAAYGKEGDTYRFYEINPEVVAIADNYFSFLKDSPAKTEVVLGDARLVLEREEPQQFDLFILDAFSGDAIPVHLLTKEAMEIYRRHLKPDGKIAFHVSNLYFDLKAIVQGLADDQGIYCQFQQGAKGATPDAYASVWALLSPEPKWLTQFNKDQTAASTRKPVLWRDDRSNLFEALK